MRAVRFGVAGLIRALTWILPLTFMIMMSWACESDGRRFGQRVTTHYAEEGEDIATAAASADRKAGGNRALAVAQGAPVVLSVAIPLVFIVATLANGKGPLGVNVPEAVGALIALALVIGVSIAAVRVQNRRRADVGSFRGAPRHGKRHRRGVGDDRPGSQARAQIDRRQMLHLLLCQIHPYPIVHARRGSDRNGDLLAPPQVALLEQHVGHMVVVGVDHQPLHRTDPAITGMHLVPSTHLHLPERHTVRDDRVQRIILKVCPASQP